MLHEAIGEPIKQLAKLFGEPIKTGSRSQRAQGVGGGAPLPAADAEGDLDEELVRQTLQAVRRRLPGAYPPGRRASSPASRTGSCREMRWCMNWYRPSLNSHSWATSYHVPKHWRSVDQLIGNTGPFSKPHAFMTTVS